MNPLDEVVGYAAELYHKQGYEFRNAVSAALDTYHFRGTERQEAFRAVCRALGSRGGKVTAKQRAQRGQMNFIFKPK